MTPRTLLVAALAAAALPVAAASDVAPAATAPVTTWSQAVTCGTGSVTVTVHGTGRVRPEGSGDGRSWGVVGVVTASVPGRPPSTYRLRYRDRSGSDAGGSVVTGRSVQLTPGGGPDAVVGTAYLAPDGFLGRFVGTAVSVCAALGA